MFAFQETDSSHKYCYYNEWIIIEELPSQFAHQIINAKSSFREIDSLSMVSETDPIVLNVPEDYW